MVDGIHYTGVATASAPWTFELEGNYSASREGGGAAYGRLRLDVSPSVLAVRMVNGHDGHDVGGYTVRPHNSSARRDAAR